MNADKARLLAAIPPEVLWVRGRHKRLGALARWCADHNFHPTLADIENERARRRAAIQKKEKNQ